MMKHFMMSAALVLALAACGGGGASIGSGTGSSSGGSGGTGGTGGGTGTGTVVTYSLGSGSGASFQPGTIAVSAPSLAAGGSTSLQVSIVDQNGTLYTSPSAVTFSSACIASGLAIINSGTPPVSEATVSTSTGTVSATYVAKGCSGADVITASATVAGDDLSATATVTVAQAAIGSIEFVSATPSNISLKGTGAAGRSETSTVVFKVLDTSSGARAGATVNFTLDTTVGGITTSPTTAVSDVNGLVQTVVNAGTVSTPVRVTATTSASTGQIISTQSNVLTISTGIPTSNNLSFGPKCANVEGWDSDGDINPVTVRLTDRFSNPVPDGTAVNFSTEGGGILSQCVTATTANESGVCTVNWVSKAPRPSDGRATIFANAIGEESFVDVNGNGTFDPPGDSLSWTDAGEPFEDDNENGTWDAGERFIDFNNNGSRDGPDGAFNGVLCQGTVCSAQKSTAIGKSSVIVMSGNHANLAAFSTTAAGPEPYTIPGTFSFSIEDDRHQQMPAGTTVEATTSSGAGDIVGTSSYTWPCSSAPGSRTFSFTLVPSTTPKPGFLFVTVTTPKGIVTSFSVQLAN